MPGVAVHAGVSGPRRALHAGTRGPTPPALPGHMGRGHAVPTGPAPHARFHDAPGTRGRHSGGPAPRGRVLTRGPRGGRTRRPATSDAVPEVGAGRAAGGSRCWSAKCSAVAFAAWAGVAVPPPPAMGAGP